MEGRLSKLETKFREDSMKLNLGSDSNPTWNSVILSASAITFERRFLVTSWSDRIGRVKKKMKSISPWRRLLIRVEFLGSEKSKRNEWLSIEMDLEIF